MSLAEDMEEVLELLITRKDTNIWMLNNSEGYSQSYRERRQLKIEAYDVAIDLISKAMKKNGLV